MATFCNFKNIQDYYAILLYIEEVLHFLQQQTKQASYVFCLIVWK